jgi:hypothetical protein
MLRAKLRNMMRMGVGEGMSIISFALIDLNRLFGLVGV